MSYSRKEHNGSDEGQHDCNTALASQAQFASVAIPVTEARLPRKSCAHPFLLFLLLLLIPPRPPPYMLASDSLGSCFLWTAAQLFLDVLVAKGKRSPPSSPATLCIWARCRYGVPG